MRLFANGQEISKKELKDFIRPHGLATRQTQRMEGLDEQVVWVETASCEEHGPLAGCANLEIHVDDQPQGVARRIEGACCEKMKAQIEDFKARR